MFLFNYLTTQNKPMSKTHLTREEKIKGWTTFIVIVLMAVFYFKFCTGNNNEPTAAPVKRKPGKLEAFTRAQSCVEENLKSPGSADFGLVDYEKAVTQVNDSTFAVIGFVDAQNSFGALLRAYYSCKVIYLTDGRGYCEDVIIQNK